MGKARPGPKPVFAKTWSKAFVSLRLMDTVRREFSQVVLEFRRRDCVVLLIVVRVRRPWEMGYFSGIGSGLGRWDRVRYQF